MDTWEPIGLTGVLAVLIAALSAYLTGCVHQWCRQGLERRAAFCAGYDHAAGALLAMAGAGPPPPVALSFTPAAVLGGRHAARPAGRHDGRGGDHQPTRIAVSLDSALATHRRKDR